MNARDIKQPDARDEQGREGEPHGGAVEKKADERIGLLGLHIKKVALFAKDANRGDRRMGATLPMRGSKGVRPVADQIVAGLCG
ncbi:hypothetical protein GCM10007385_25290 [Tateyamaria omphalii]|nr:hypothetical protein GCM10007385_25290 [Tateyamaria omphalii]